MSFTVDGWRGEAQLKASAWPSHQSRKVAGAVPALVEFEVDDIDAATQELQDGGYTLSSAPATSRGARSSPA
jgi:hypothetical protein